MGEYDQNHPSEVFPIVRGLVWRFEIQKTQKNLFFVSSQPKSSVFWTVCRDLNIWPLPKIKNIFFKMCKVRLLREKSFGDARYRNRFSVYFGQNRYGVRRAVLILAWCGLKTVSYKLMEKARPFKSCVPQYAYLVPACSCCRSLSGTVNGFVYFISTPRRRLLNA